MSKIILYEGATPATPAAGKILLWAATNGKIYAINDAGDITEMAPQNSFDGWRDIRTPFIAGRLAGLSDPTLGSFGPGTNVKQFKFSIGNEAMLAWHIDHDIKVGSTVYPHIHWSTDGTNSASVKWELNITVAGRNDVTAEAFGAETQFLLEAAGSGIQWGHVVTEDATGFTAPVVDSLVLGHIKRITNGGTDNSDNVFGLFVDLHYEADRYATVSRSPPFYS